MKSHIPTRSARFSILLTIDVEDWFQVENFKECVPYSSWSSYELRVERNTHRLLDLFDSFSSTVNSQLVMSEDQQTTNNTQHTKVHCTFFILGWLAERLPNLVREIHSRGHEVASHGYHHELVNEQPYKDLKQDLTNSKKLLEDITGAPVYGYRAPSFSVNHDLLKLIRDCGYLYDSSYNSFALQGRYGKLNLPNNESQGIAIDVPRSQCKTEDLRSNIQNSKLKTPHCFYELPISNLQFKIQNSKFKIVLPWGGGGYFRLIPFSLFKKGVKCLLKKNGAYLFYMHPWEIDPHQPKVNAVNRSYRFRHYVNLDKTFSRLEIILQDFKSCRFVTCSEYLNVQHAPSFKIQNS